MDASLAAKAFIVKDGKILILKRSNYSVQKPGLWEIPGGRLGVGEDPFVGLKREVMEETGLDIDVKNPLSVRHFTRADEQKVTLIIFLCNILKGDLKLSNEHIDFDWVDIDKAKEKVGEFFHKDVDIFNKYFKS